MSRFQFKKFTINQSRSALKVSTDAMVFGSTISCKDAVYGLDVGSGTGVLSLMVAQNHPEILIDAVEIDINSFEDLVQNINLSDFKNRIKAINTNFFVFEPGIKYDLIFSNPPFYDDGLKFDKDDLFHSKHNLNFSISDFYLKSRDLLKKQGQLWIIVPNNRYKTWIEVASKYNFNLTKQIIIESKPGKEVRSILVFSNCLNLKYELSKFIIRNEDGLYTEEYHLLTSEFHNKKPLK